MPRKGWILFNHIWYQWEDDGSYEEFFGPYFISEINPYAFLIKEKKGEGRIVLYENRTLKTEADLILAIEA
jgi:hypothetical protein